MHNYKSFVLWLLVMTISSCYCFERRMVIIISGGGSVAIAGDGGLRQWQISNKVNHLAAVPDSFFAIK